MILNEINAKHDSNLPAHYSKPFEGKHHLGPAEDDQ